MKTFQEKGYKHGAAYLGNLSDRLFTNIELWLKAGIIAPKATSLLGKGENKGVASTHLTK